MKTIITCHLLAFAFAFSGFAQGPSETAEAYFALLKAREYRKAADFYEPAALKEIRGTLDFGEALPEATAKQFYAQFFGAGATRQSVSKMSDADFFAGYLSYVMNQAKAVGVNTFEDVVILGEEAKGEDVVQVRTRHFGSQGERKLETEEVVSFRKSSGKWKLMLPEKMKKSAGQSKKALQMMQKALEMQKKALQQQ